MTECDFKSYIRSIIEETKSLVIFKGLKQEKIFLKLNYLLHILLEQNSRLAAVGAYSDLVADLLLESEKTQPFGTIWHNYILEQIITAENIFTRQAEIQDMVPEILVSATKVDLNILEKLYRLNWQLIEEQIFKGKLTQSILQIDEHQLGKTHNISKTYSMEKIKLKQAMDNTKGWEKLIPVLTAFYKKWGTGVMAEYWVFKYNGRALEGITNPDPIRLEELVGYDSQRKDIIDNTEQFVKGYTANNILLYGDRGTGKSSTVKGLIHKFGEQGLRLVEVSLKGLVKLPCLLRELSNRPQRFIIFIDDLSFEEYETQYKELKAVLEGGVEVQPQNVLIYATSNRRHLVKERFSDRDINKYSISGDEIRVQDTMQEKLSLSDRFGMTVYFTSPAQKEYLEIVRSIAAKRGINIDQEQLDKMALQWELMQNSRSGRTAKQFVDNLAGKLKIKS